MGIDPGAAGRTSGVSGAQGDGGKAVPPGIDTSTAHPARVYDYWLGATCSLYLCCQLR